MTTASAPQLQHLVAILPKLSPLATSLVYVFFKDAEEYEDYRPVLIDLPKCQRMLQSLNARVLIN